ncbi:ABC transporter permease [Pseudonocardia sp. CA-107938]|uniref:ABC transporter permease n=1 Tax=Pseudonocardia sp. CA-107938 TaxID=3240021 RepID=UPI003D8DF52D
MIASLRALPLRVYVTVVALVLAAPSLVLIPLSFTRSSTLEFPPTGFSTQWYRRFFTSSNWLDATAHSVVIGVLTMIVSVALGVPLALALVRGRFRGVGLLHALVLGPAVVPVVITAIGTYAFMTGLGLTRTMLGLVIAHTVLALPMVVVTVTASAQTLDPALELAAAGLGAGRIATFRHAVLPALAPGIAIGAVYGFVTSWDEMVVSLFLTGPTYTTLPVTMWNQVRNSSDPTAVAVSTMLVALSTIALFAIVFTGRAVTRRKQAPG